MPKISIITPVYKVEKYIGRCIESILGQAFTDWELILVNDCSPDDSKSIIRRYLEADCRIRYFEHSRNQGPMAARKTGYTNALGNFLFFCDADDTLPYDSLQFLYNAITQTHADIVSGNAQYFKLDGGTLEFNYSLPYGENPESVYRAVLMSKYHHVLWNKLFSRNLFLHNQLDCFDDATNAEDAYLFYQIIQFTQSIVHYNHKVYNYHQNELSTMNNRLTKKGLLSIVLYLKLLRDDLSIKYPRLENLFNEHITKLLINKFEDGYEKELNLNTIFKEQNFTKYYSISFMIIHYGLIKTAKYLRKRYFHRNNKLRI